MPFDAIIFDDADIATMLAIFMLRFFADVC